jgi:hypothetical protein
LIRRIDFPDFGTAPESISDFWNLQVLKNPRHATGHFKMEDDSEFIPLAAAVANVVRWLEGNHRHQKDRERQTGRQRNEEDQPERHIDDVERPLKEKPPT